MFEKLPLIIGHRGASAFLPENTIEAFRMAFEKFRADMIEFDVHTAKNGVPVVIHDATLERTTNGRGYISDWTSAELKKFDAGFYFKNTNQDDFPERAKGHRIPTLEEVFIHFPGRKLSIEIKEKSAELTHSVIRLVKKYKAEEICVVGSKHDLVSKTMRDAYPSIYRFYSKKEIVRGFFDFKQKSKAKKENLAVASMPLQSCGMAFDNQGFMDYLHEKGVKSFFWTINDPTAISSLYQKKADGIITDKPDLARTVIGRTNETGPTTV